MRAGRGARLPALARRERMPERTRTRRGRLLLVGGAERRDPDHEILSQFVALSGGEEAKVLVVGAATREPQDCLPDYRRVFQRLGAGLVWTSAFRDRAEGERRTLLEHLEAATAVYFTGGDQLRLTMHVAGTTFGERLRERHNSGDFLVGGTSAGAVAMGSLMILSGPGGGSVRRADVRMGPGLGLVRDAMTDTHFNERAGVPRLLAVYAQRSPVLGVGLDENTGSEVPLGQEVRVLGSGAGTVFDGRLSY